MKNRQTVRDALAVLLEAEVVTLLAIAESVETGRVIDTLEGQGPVLAVLAGGSYRDVFTRQGMKSQFRLEVQIWTPYLSATGWTASEAEGRCDRLEQAVAEVVEANRANCTHWLSLGYAGPSQPVDFHVDSGQLYIFEMIPLEVKVGS